MVVKQCGKINHLQSHNSDNHGESKKTLKDLKFEIGDFLDVAITPIKNSNDHNTNNNTTDNRDSYRGYRERERGDIGSSSYSAMNRERESGYDEYSHYYGNSRGGYRRGRGRGRGRGYNGYRGRGRSGYDRRGFRNFD